MNLIGENILYDSLFKPHLANSDTFLKLKNGAQISFENFVQQTDLFANVFRYTGLKKGDRVLLKVKKSPQALAVYAACVQTGTVLVPLNPAYTKNELTYFIEDATPSLIICDQSEQQQIERLIAESNIRLLTLNDDGSGSLMTYAAEVLNDHQVIPCSGDDLVALLYTSGTTGRPKGAMLSHANLLSNAQSLSKCWQFSSHDLLLHALPIFHTHGLFVACNVSLLAGNGMIFLPGFDLDLIIESLPQATTMMGVPTFYMRLLNDNRFTKELAASMRLFISGSAPMQEETHHDFKDKTDHIILERYGMTETNMNTSNPYYGERRIGTVGLALSNISVRVNDPVSGSKLPNNEIGVIQVNGPNVFKGYWNLPEKTAEEFTEDGFFITGDLGFIDDEGYLTIIGRQKDLIISGGYNVYPKEVETVIDAIDGVKESAVIGIADTDFGERVVAVVVKQQTLSIAETGLIEAVRKQLAAYKCPKQIFFVDELPRNSMGKVQRNILREQFS